MCKFQYNDGGRAAALGTNETAGDCVARALSIATGLPYKQITSMLVEGMQSVRKTRKTKRFLARNGFKKSSDITADKGILKRKFLYDMIEDLGFMWIPTMGIGTGCRVHLRADELPSGTVICMVSKHMVCVKDGVIHDTYDPSRAGTRTVYGYWIKK